MTDVQAFDAQLGPHCLGFIRGALRFGGSPTAIQEAIRREFPRLDAQTVARLVTQGANTWGQLLN